MASTGAAHCRVLVLVSAFDDPFALIRFDDGSTTFRYRRSRSDPRGRVHARTFTRLVGVTRPGGRIVVMDAAPAALKRDASGRRLLRNWPPQGDGLMPKVTVVDPHDGYLEFQRRPQPMLEWYAKHMS